MKELLVKKYSQGLLLGPIVESLCEIGLKAKRFEIL